MPLYTSMVAQGLEAAGLEPVFLASRHLVEPGIAGAWQVKRWLPAPRWPRPPGAKAIPAWRQAVTWLFCSATILFATIVLRPKVVHFQHPIHWRLDPLLVKLLRLFTVVAWTAHDVLPHDGGRNADARASRLYNAVDVVLVHSQPAGEQVLKLSGVSAIVIDHPVRTVENKPDRSTARRILGLDPDRRVAAAVGFIRAYKGYALLADIWETMGAEAPLLLVMGELVDDSERLTIQRLQVCVNTDIRLGYASEQDIIAAMAAADIILLPHAKGSDSGSLHVARALGTPVISSDSPQLASVVESNGAGLVLPREARRWAAALSGVLPPPPPPPPAPVETGRAHAQAYGTAGA